MKFHFYLATLLIGLSLFVFPEFSEAQSSPITFRAPHFDEEVTFFGLGPRAELFSSELGQLGRLMRCRRTKRIHKIHPALARQLVRIARRFKRPVAIVSGYRSVPIHGHKRSYHLRGMAADIYVPGIAAEDLRDYAVQQKVRGVGFYPSSGFVHIDIRPRRFWWVDYSRPGRIQNLIPDPEGKAPTNPPSKTHDHVAHRH